MLTIERLSKADPMREMGPNWIVTFLDCFEQYIESKLELYPQDHIRCHKLQYLRWHQQSIHALHVANRDPAFLGILHETEMVYVGLMRFYLASTLRYGSLFLLLSHSVWDSELLEVDANEAF